MTDEEKQKKINAAKARIANKAVTVATAVSALTPTLSNAQAAEQSADFSPTPIEQTVSTMPSQTNIMSIEEAENLPTFGSDEWLKTQMISDREEHDAAVAVTPDQITEKDSIYAEAMEIDISKYIKQRQELAESLHSPATNDDFDGHIGNWSSTTAYNYTILPTYHDDGSPRPKFEDIKTSDDWIKYKRDTPPARDIPDNPHEFLSLKNHNYELVDAPKNQFEDNALAYFSPTEGKIIIHNYSDKEKAQNANVSDRQSEFIKGNPFARIATLYHENVHAKHILYDGAGENKKTPINAAKNDRLTETIANAAEYLATAQQYCIMKEQGIQTIQIPQTESLLPVFEEYSNLPDKNNLSFQQYLQTKNITHFSNENQSITGDNVSLILPDAEKKLENALTIQQASISLSDGETDILAGFAYMADSSRPLSEQLKGFDVTNITINEEQISVDELETKYPNIKEMMKDYTETTKTYVSSLQEKPLESVLEFYPGLKDAMPEGKFDPNNSEQIEKIVQASSEYWHKERKEGYESQSIGAAETSSFPYYTWSEQLEILKNQDQTYAEVSERMLKNIYIGQGVSLDLTNCRKVLDTMSNEDAVMLIQKHNQTALNDDYIAMASYDEMKEVDTYLESIGLKTDEEKMKYMSDFINSAVTRDNQHQDPALSKILLSQNPHIGYVDGIAVNPQDGLTGQDETGNKYDLTNLTTLPQTLHADMRQDRETHDAELRSQIDMLTHPTQQSVQTHANENQTVNQTISPAMMMSLQQNTR